MKKLNCDNGHELAIMPDKQVYLSAKDLTHPKLKDKFKEGDILKKCPDCNALGLKIEKI